MTFIVCPSLQEFILLREEAEASVSPHAILEVEVEGGIDNQPDSARSTVRGISQIVNHPAFNPVQQGFTSEKSVSL